MIAIIAIKLSLIAFLLPLLLTVDGFTMGTASKLIDRIHRPKLIRSDESVIFFPTSSYQEKDSDEWVVPVHGWIFDDERRGLRRRAFVSLLYSTLVRDGRNKKSSTTDSEVDDEERILELAQKNKGAKEILARRILPFVVDNHRRRQITIRFGDGQQFELPVGSRKNGHFNANLRLSNDEIASMKQQQQDGVIHYQAVTGIKDDPRQFKGRSILVPRTPGALSIISDIDDTVKDSHVLEKGRLLRNTFLEEFHVVPGMADLYNTWKAKHPDMSFHFVSSSPWQLYEEISNFLRKEGFPEASFHLKPVRVKDRTLLSLFADPFDSKIAKISSILETFPTRQFVLVGDSGEKDPEVYGEICRRFPHQIQRVFLRDVTSNLSDEVLAKHERKAQKKKVPFVLNAPDRYKKAFLRVPSETWTVFTEPSSIEL